MSLQVPAEHQGALGVLRDLMSLTDANPEDISATQATGLRKMFEDPTVGLFLFATVVFGYKDLTTTLHLPMCTFLGRWGQSVLDTGEIITTPPGLGQTVEDSYRRLMVAIPREMFKTSVCTRANALWQIVRNPNATVAIFHENEAKAEMWVGAIGEVVERSKLFQAVWPDLVPPGLSFRDREEGRALPRKWKWGNTGLLFQRDQIGIPELSIQGFGIGGAGQGYHFTHKILDDIIGKNAAYSQAVMQDAINWVDNSRPLERPAEKGNELVVYTTWAYHDVYAHMIKRWPGDYKVYKRHILEDLDGNPDHITGESIFPEKFSTPEAKQLLKTDPFVNFAQYQLQPRPGRDQSFDESWFRYGALTGNYERPVFRIRDDFYDPTLFDPESGDKEAPQFIPLHWMNKALILDPAPSRQVEISREPRAGNGIVAVGKDPWGRRFVFESKSLRVGPTEILEELITMAARWGIVRIGIEVVNFSAVYQPLFEEILRHTHPDTYLEFFPLETKGRQKDERIKQNLIRVFENGYWYFADRGTARLAQELLEFPHSDTKDLPDALSYTDEALARPDPPGVSFSNDERRKQLERQLGATGYGAFNVGEAR